MKYIMVAFWFILFMCGINLSLHLISNPSSLENVLGVVILVITFLITIKTNFFTNLTIKRK